MSDEDEKPAPAAIPAWQTAQSQPDATPAAESQDASSGSSSETEHKTEDEAGETKDDSEDEEVKKQDEEDDLTVARRFLSDPSVQSSPLPSKIKFLQNKGLSESTIQTLLGTDNTEKDAAPLKPAEPSSQPPIITYPEFLQSSSDDTPPLVTSAALLTTLQATTLVSAAIYGTSQLYLQPLLARLNDSRSEFHTSVAGSLSSIISKLESSVSELPPPPPSSVSAAAAAKKRDLDSDSDADDPSELFHRDVGTQTTLQPVTDLSSPPEKKSSPSETQATQLTALTAKLSSLRDDITTQSDDLGDVKTLIDVFRDDLDVLTYRNSYTDTTGYNYLSRLSSSSPATNQNADKDEIDKARNNIRRIKGVLLSSRSFPASTR